MGERAQVHDSEITFIERSERRVAAGLAFALLLMAGGIVAIAIPGRSAVPYGGVAIFLGFFLAWGFAAWKRLFPEARKALSEAPRDLLLDRWFELSRFQSTHARLWEECDRDRPLAVFDWTQWSQPLWMRSDKQPVQVYGEPRRGAVVVVVSAEGLLVGRIERSRLDEPTGEPPRGLGWLLKPRRLRL